MSEEIKDVKVEEPKKEKVVKEKEVKKEVKETKKEEVAKVEEPKKEVKTVATKQFIVGASVIDKRKNQFVVEQLPEGELQDHSKIVIKSANGVLSVQLKGKLQLV